tara:strand:- start:16 stop:183 length:168 start_codon:yes stop_codon:yes gene_type:complete
MSLHPEIASQLEDIVDDLIAEGYSDDEAVDIAWTRFSGWSEIGGYYHITNWSITK